MTTPPFYLAGQVRERVSVRLYSNPREVTDCEGASRSEEKALYPEERTVRVIGPLSRRRILQFTGATSLAMLAGCTSTVFGSSDAPAEYTLSITKIEASPVKHALYEPSDDEVFGQPARTALKEILPIGRYTTYGYKPLPDDAYVEYDGAYYQTENTVTGRKDVKQTVVRVSPVQQEDVPDNAILIDSLQQPSARVLKILHAYTRSNGKTSTADLLHGDAYVLRRPAEKNSRFVTGDLNGRVVMMTEAGVWAYRVHVTHDVITEPAYTLLTIPVAESRETFREVVFGSRIDAELTPEDVPQKAQRIIEEAIGKSQYVETAPLSPEFEMALGFLKVGDANSRVVNGKLLWYDDGYYRYSLYVNRTS